MWLTGPTFLVQAISGAASSPAFGQLVVGASRFLFLKQMKYMRKCCDDEDPRSQNPDEFTSLSLFLPTYLWLDSPYDLGNFFSVS
jgi:hypothetical protein